MMLQTLVTINHVQFHLYTVRLGHWIAPAWPVVQKIVKFYTFVINIPKRNSISHTCIVDFAHCNKILNISLPNRINYFQLFVWKSQPSNSQANHTSQFHHIGHDGQATVAKLCHLKWLKTINKLVCRHISKPNTVHTTVSLHSIGWESFPTARFEAKSLRFCAIGRTEDNVISGSAQMFTKKCNYGMHQWTSARSQTDAKLS